MINPIIWMKIKSNKIEGSQFGLPFFFLPEYYVNINDIDAYQKGKAGVSDAAPADGVDPQADPQKVEDVASDVAGKGPPWTIASQTSTPVGQPLTSTRPALRSRVGRRRRAASRSASSRCRYQT